MIHAFWREIPDIGTFWTGAYQRLVEDVEVDNFGTLGDRMLLDLLGICEGLSLSTFQVEEYLGRKGRVSARLLDDVLCGSG